FYLPRLFVYHAPAEDRISLERFQVMERKLFWGIMTPGAVLTVVFGTWLWLGWFRGAFGAWFHANLALLVVFSADHLCCRRIMKPRPEGRNASIHVWFRWFNKFPVLILFATVFLVVFKPF